MFERGVKVDVVADLHRHAHLRRLSCARRTAAAIALAQTPDRRRPAKQLREPRAQRPSRRASGGKQRIEHRRLQQRALADAVEAVPPRADSQQIEDLRADRNAQMRGAPSCSKTPNGRFWIGKSLSAATAIHDSSARVGRIGRRAHRAPKDPQRGQDRRPVRRSCSCRRQRTTARGGSLARRAWIRPVAPRKSALLEAKRGRIFFCNDRTAAFREIDARRERRRPPSRFKKPCIGKPVGGIDVAHRMMQAGRRFERHVRGRGAAMKLRDLVNAWKCIGGHAAAAQLRAKRHVVRNDGIADASVASQASPRAISTNAGRSLKARCVHRARAVAEHRASIAAALRAPRSRAPRCAQLPEMRDRIESAIHDDRERAAEGCGALHRGATRG